MSEKQSLFNTLSFTEEFDGFGKLESVTVSPGQVGVEPGRYFHIDVSEPVKGDLSLSDFTELLLDGLSPLLDDRLFTVADAALLCASNSRFLPSDGKRLLDLIHQLVVRITHDLNEVDDEDHFINEILVIEKSPSLDRPNEFIVGVVSA